MRWVQISPHQDVMKLAATKHQPHVNHTLIYMIYSINMIYSKETNV